MNALRFNPIAYSHKLQDAGLEQKIAEVQAEELSNFINNDIMTKQDGILLKNELFYKIDEEKGELKQNIKDLEIRMVSLTNQTSWKVIGLLAALQALFHFIK